MDQKLTDRNMALGLVYREISLKCGANSSTDSKFAMATEKTRRTTFEKSSGNVFADIGLANKVVERETR